MARRSEAPSTSTPRSRARDDTEEWIADFDIFAHYCYGYISGAPLGSTNIGAKVIINNETAKLPMLFLQKRQHFTQIHITLPLFRTFITHSSAEITHRQVWSVVSVVSKYEPNPTLTTLLIGNISLFSC